MSCNSACCEPDAQCCPDCGAPMTAAYPIRMIPARGQEGDLLDEIQARLDFVRARREEGWDVRSTATALVCEPPDQEEDLLGRLRGFGLGDDVIWDWNDQIGVRAPEEILEAAREYAATDEYLAAAEEVEDDGPDGPCPHCREVLGDFMEWAEEEYDLAGFEVEDDFDRGVLAGRREALEWVLGGEEMD